MPAEHVGGLLAAAQGIKNAFLNRVGLGNTRQELAEFGNTKLGSNGSREQGTGKKKREAATPESREALPRTTKPNLSKRNHASEDELRICGDFRQPPDAVLISIPTLPTSAMPSKVPTGDFRPLNTLHQGPQRNVSQFFPGSGSSSQYQSRAVDSALTKKPHFSSTKVLSAFDDNNEFVKRKHMDLTEANASSRKRQKVDSPRKSPSPSSLGEVSVGSGNRLHPIIERQVRRVDPSEYISFSSISAQTRSQRTIHSGHPRDRQQKNEFRAVESLVNPRLSSAPSQSVLVHDDSIDDLSKEVSVYFEETDNDPNPISWSMIDDGRASDAGTRAPNSGDDAKMALQLRRTQRREHESSKFINITGGSLSRSPQVPGRSDQRPLKHGVTTSNGRVATLQVERLNTSEGRGLVPTQLDRRQVFSRHTILESLDNSIDELANESTVDQREPYRPVTHRPLSEEKPPLKTPLMSENQLRPTETRSFNDDDVSSNDIRATDFYSSKKPRHGGQDEVDKEQRPGRLLRRYKVRKFRTGDLRNKAAECTLRYEYNSRSFVLEDQQHKLIRAGVERAPLAIHPTSVWWGMYSEESPYFLHLISGPSSIDWHWVDIEFSGLEDLVGFLDEFNRTTSQRVKFEVKSSNERAGMRSQQKPPSKNIPQQETKGLTLPQNRVGKRDNSTASNDVLPPAKRSRQTTLVAQLQPEPVHRKSIMTGNSADVEDEILYDISTDPGTTDPKAERRSNGSIKTYGAKRTSRQKPAPLELDFEVPDDQKYSRVKGLGTAWKKPLVFPADGPKKVQVTVDFEDLYRLDEGEFLNDTLIQFYLRYCEVNSPKQSNASVLIFTTYFYTSLTTPAKGKRGINYDSVKRWTAKLEQSDIFNYDFIIVPVNENAHWYLAIICNLTNINRTYHAEESEEPQTPITGMDNLWKEAHDDPSGVDEVRPDEVNDDEDAVRERYSQMSLEEEDNQLPSSQNAIESHFRSDTRAGAGEVPRATSETYQAVPEVIEAAQIGAASAMHKQPGAGIKEGNDSGEVAGTANKRVKRKSGGGGLRKYDPDQPMIITLDSLGGSHPGTVKNLKDYLVAEAREKRSMDIPDGKIQGLTAKGIPEQANYCDCGLFLLGYAAKFLENPRKFVRKIAQREFDVEADWPELNPSDMRNHIRTLLQTLYAEQSGAKAPKNDAEVEKEEQPSAELAATDKGAAKPLQVLASGPSSSMPKDELRIKSPLSKRAHWTGEAVSPESRAYESQGLAVAAAPETQLDCSSAETYMARAMPDDRLEIPNISWVDGKEHNDGKHETEAHPEDDEMLDKGPQIMADPDSSPGKGKTTGKRKLFGQELPITSKDSPSARKSRSPPSRRLQPVVLIESPPRKAVQSKAQSPTVGVTNSGLLSFAYEPAGRSKSKERRRVDLAQPPASVAGPLGDGHSHPLVRIHVDDARSREVSIPRTSNSPLMTVRDDISTPPRPPTRGKQ